MNLQQLLSSPPPPTGWVVDGDLVAVVTRDRRGVLECAAQPLPAGVVEPGPVGLHRVDVDKLGRAIAAVKGTLAGDHRAAVVVPSRWVRCQLLTVERLPRRHHEVEDVLRWRLKKVLPVPVTDLRLSWTAFPAQDGRRPLLCIAGLERALAAFEQSFVEAGVVPGMITSRAFALVSGLEWPAGAHLLVQQEPGFLTLLLTVDGSPRLLRTKTLPGAGDATAGTVREMHLAMTYIRETLAVEGPLRVQISADSAEIERELRRFWVEQHDAEAELPAETAAPAEIASSLGPARLAAVESVLSGRLA